MTLGRNTFGRQTLGRRARHSMRLAKWVVEITDVALSSGKCLSGAWFSTERRGAGEAFEGILNSSCFIGGCLIVKLSCHFEKKISGVPISQTS